MFKRVMTPPTVETSDDLIDLGAVTAETKGPPGGNADASGQAQAGISDE